ncbi:MAG: PAS domain S-box protein, partial [Bacillota bacterium]|nr:PAS domain S-box protein [Bacillota bacterium]
LLQEWIHCHSIGIRILNEDGFIPYEAYVGFSKEFWECESWLSVIDNQCACIRVINEKPEPQDAICMTKGGSFCSNNTIKFVSEMPVDEQARFRGKCVEFGFHSIAIVPIRYRHKIFGAIHFADKQVGRIPLQIIEFIEKVSPLIGEAIYRFNLEDELRQQKNNLEKLVGERTNELKQANDKLKNDNAELKRLGQQLINSNEQVTDILESITDAFFALDSKWNIRYINKTAKRLFNKTDICIGQNFWHVFPLAINSLFYNNYSKVMAEKIPIHFESKSIYVNEGWVEVDAYPSQDGISVYFRNITDRKNMEEKLRISEERFYKAFNHCPASMSLYSIDKGQYIDSNESCQLMHGYSRDEFIGRSALDLNLWVDIDQLAEFLKDIDEKGFVNNLEVRNYKKSGEIFISLTSAVVINLNGEQCILVIKSDITELRKYQNEILRLDKLNLVGEMAAGIAHEIRNPMTTVKGFLQILGAKREYSHNKEFFDLMIDELDRANSIITEFLSLAKNKAVDFKTRNLNDIVRQLYPLITADATLNDKQVVLELSEIPNLRFDEREIRQLILNLARNGLEAMTKGRCLRIKTMTDNDEVVLAVIDQGSGIDSQFLDKISTPFFTTKDNGVGLGLATCYSIANRHKAKINFDTGPEGTTFYVRFMGISEKQG